MTDNLLAMPKAAAKFMVDAENAGFTVKIESHDADSVAIWVERQDGDFKRNAALIWQVVNVAGMNSRLGFATSYERGVRFGYASVQVGYDYPIVKSVRGVRFALGIPVN